MDIFRKKSSGFTLIELLLVISILGLLVSIIIVALGGGEEEARDAKRKAELNTINKALIFYNTDHGAYPVSPNWVSLEDKVSPEGVALRNEILPYLPTIPEDPLYGFEKSPGYLYSYMYISTTSQSGEVDYKVHAELESDSDDSFEVYSPGGEGIVYAPPWYCGDTITYAGQVYDTVQIGAQCWFRENLNVGTMINGSEEQGVSCVSIDKYCYNNNEANCASDGALYQLDQAMCGPVVSGGQGICPAGWHIPTDAEFHVLENAYATGSCDPDRNDLWGCDPAASHLSYGTLNGDNSSGFTAVTAGMRSWDGLFYSPWYAIFWTSTVTHRIDSARIYELYEERSDIYLSSYDLYFGLSLRCLKD